MKYFRASNNDQPKNPSKVSYRSTVTHPSRNSFFQFLAFALATVAVAEPPSGYNYNRPSSGGNQGGYSHGGGGGGGGYPSSSGGSGYVSSFSSAGSFSSGGGSLQNVPVGGQTSEGLNVDPQLLNEIRQILLREEGQSSSSGGFGGSAPSGSYGPPSGSYGAPAPVYGAPGGGSSRVVGIDLEGVRQAIQVAQYLQTATGGSSGGYPSGPSGGYPSAPSGSYGTPSVPSGSYGAPSRPSGSYGAPY